MDWKNLIEQFGTAAVTGVMSMAFVQFAYTHCKEWYNRWERKRHLALQIAQHLEAFAINTSDKLADDFHHWDTEGHHGSPMGDHPKITPPPASPDYQILNARLVDRLYALSLDCESTSSSIASAFDALDGEDAYEIKQERFLELMKRVFLLARDFRRRHWLSARPSSGEGWNREKWVDEEIANIAERKERVRRDHAARWVPPPPPQASLS